MARKKAEPRPKEREPESESTSGSPGRPIWSGSISFGLVNVPVSLYSLEQRSDLHFRMIDSRDHAAIRYERVNELTGEEVPWDQIVKAYEYSDDNYIVLTKEDFESVRVDSVRAIDVQAFVDRVEIDEMFFDKPYIVLPKKRAEKGYVLLRDVLKQSGRVGIAKVAIRSREYLAALMPRGDALVVMLLRFAQELKSLRNFKLPHQDTSEYNVSERELDLAAQLVDAMTVPWEPAAYHDEYRKALMDWIETKAESGGLTARVSAEEDELPETSNVLDLAALLKESMAGKTKRNKA
ncbi:MAG: Ku protein [Armatimonadetes bacterium]|nr:Ku protein [Armatimonadota bacterium]